MKITDLISLALSPIPSPVPSGGGDKFAACLKEAMTLRDSEKASPALGGPSPVQGTAPGRETGAAGEMVETVLSRLELFQEALARPGLPLKGLAPLAQALDEDSRRLTTLAQSLPTDSPLRQVTEETAALTWTQGYKFKRGDFL